MSSLTKPGGTVAGTPIDPASPGGILIDPETELSGSPTLYQVIQGDGLGGWVIGLQPSDIQTPFSTDGGVPGGAGVRYLNHNGIASSALGVLLPGAAILLGITFTADVADATRTYQVQVLTDPAGTPAVIATLDIALSTTLAKRRDLSVAIPVDVPVGVRLVRLTGGGVSDFNNVHVEIETLVPR